jgi:hypothetical protein
MDLSDAVRDLTHHMEVIQAMTHGLSDEQAQWRHSDDSWSILEVANHLLDEEREDFRVRLDYTLNKPGEAWPEIDPQGWVAEREYNERDLESSLKDLKKEREESLKWLQELGEVDFDTAAEAPWGGTVRAGDILAAWVAHDLLHLRQLVQIRFTMVAASAAPYTTEYAGLW